MFLGSPSASCQSLFTLLLTSKEASLPELGHIVVYRAPCSLASLAPVLRRTLTPSGGRRHHDPIELHSPLHGPHGSISDNWHTGVKALGVGTEYPEHDEP